MSAKVTGVVRQVVVALLTHCRRPATAQIERVVLVDGLGLGRVVVDRC